MVHLLQELKEQITSGLERTKNAQEQTLVIEQILSEKELKNPEKKWVSNRRVLFLKPLEINELTIASSAAKKLRESFESLLANEMTTSRMNSLLIDIDGLLSVIEIFFFYCLALNQEIVLMFEEQIKQ